MEASDDDDEYDEDYEDKGKLHDALLSVDHLRPTTNRPVKMYWYIPPPQMY